MFRLSSMVLFLFFSTIAPALANVLTVGKNEKYKTIQSAVEAANNGDQIIIKTGVYLENNIEIKKSITIKGEGYPVIDARGKGQVFTILSNGVTIQGLHIKNIGTNYLKDNAAIKTIEVKHCKILNNKIQNSYFGIFLANTDSTVVSGNIIIGSAVKETSSGNAIHLWYCKKINISKNTVKGHRDGIYFEFVEDSDIKDNYSEGNLRYGLHFMFSDRNIYTSNTFKGNGAGVAVMYSRNIVMKKNRFVKNWGPASYGILLKDITDSEISGNYFSENTIGIFADGTNRVVINENEFHKNGWGVKIMGHCEEVKFERNNFISNTFEVSTNSNNRSSYSFSGNYWSSYSGYDLDRDGKGDIPHRPVKLFSFLADQTPASIILLRSMFVELLEVAEKIAPIFTPVNLEDNSPSIKINNW